MENNNAFQTKIVNKSKKLPKPGTYARAVVVTAQAPVRLVAWH